MEYVGQAIVILIVILAAAAVIKLPAWRRKRRQREMANLAGELGWKFVPTEDEQHEFRFPLGVFNRGVHSAAFNTITGKIDVRGESVPVTMGDFVYWVKSGVRGGGSTRNYCSYMLVHVPLRNVPDLHVRSESKRDRLANALGLDDIDFESAAFSERFHVTSSNKRFAFDIIHPRMMELLMSASPPGLSYRERTFLHQRWTQHVGTGCLHRIAALGI